MTISLFVTKLIVTIKQIDAPINEKLLKLLKTNFSESRLIRYINLTQSKNLNEADTIYLYQLNIQICQELYSLIHFIEICLKNSIHKQMTKLYDSEEWYDNVSWYDTHQKQLGKLKEEKLYKPSLRFIFSNYKNNASRMELSKRLRNLVILRNRISHFEIIKKTNKN